MTINIAIADDQALVRGALSALLGLEPDITVVGEAASGTDAVDMCLNNDVDVALFDIEMPGLNGIEATRELCNKGSDTKVLIVTTFGRPGYLQRALAAGAKGFVVKDAPAEELAEAVRKIYRGEQAVDPALAIESISLGPSPLTEREREVLAVAHTGASVRTIADSLFLSEGTVRNHLSSAISKLGVDNRSSAAIEAAKRGWL
ncbi:response regulator transcription factor [Brevibacterium sp. UMB1308A]|uniref:response regulator transcription factor n=1 Tax=Brevibacterium sp. UMB1308A TaxID=3050608 RepID=UPI00254DFB7F|nr:response regulator transcription factor [Brevibacterium sp. UMB1308A]MDK8345912.1 response regulator transcription factor [Brevibacterium sp. UMB1308B]MDK8712988.1 response regulator transcription factor [Brevibacterium sp. UMB1308A]